MAAKRLWYLDPRFKDISGLRSERLVADRPDNRRGYWVCRCDCGAEKPVRADHIRTGKTRSCGCLKADWQQNPTTVTHGHTRKGRKAVEYGIWNTMIQRCHNPASTSWPRYGYLGVQVCKRWRDDFTAFLADVGPRPGPGYSLERKNNSGDYELGNVIWATSKDQANNKRNNRRLEFSGRTMTLQQWADELGLRSRMIWQRLRRGWSVERALTEPEQQIDDPVLCIGGREQPLTAWAKEYGITARRIKVRLGRGWTPERAVTEPISSKS